MTEPLLHVDDVTVSYRQPGRTRLTAVNGVSLTLDRGQVLGLVGESGCGKSTLARSICGLEPLQSGQIVFNGQPVGRLGLRRRPKALIGIQMVFQNPYASLNPRRAVGSQIEDGLRASTHRDRWTVAGLLDEVELDRGDAARYPHEFSGGQRQRIAIARAIAAGPDLLIGDEAIASLDASLQAKIARLMCKLALETDAALLFISHDLAVVRVIADEVAVMSRGVVVERGPVEQVWNEPKNPYTRKLLAAIPAVDGLGRLPGASPIAADG
ncbi:MAG: ATP-binding cassette domain-containing protein [Cryobacterium sp.]|nr:ATP-binding cassette domain-containing protein [Cryobacterium sp.]